MALEFRDITSENYLDVFKLKVKLEQKSYVVPNVYCIAESKVYENFNPKALYLDNELIGFLMYGTNPKNESDVWIISLMIDEKFQGKGYGKHTMLKSIQILRELYDPPAIYISFDPENEIAKKLYTSIGFKDTGEILYGKLVHRLDFKNQNQ